MLHQKHQNREVTGYQDPPWSKLLTAANGYSTNCNTTTALTALTDTTTALTVTALTTTLPRH